MPEPHRSKIADLFASDIRRPIEEVIKVDALDDSVLLEEIREYHPTPSIQEQMSEVLEAYAALHRGPTERVGVWVSGFFGAGKSSFAKLLGVLLGSRKVGAQDTIDLFSQRITSPKIKVLLQQIREHIPTHVVIFDILKDHIAGAMEHPVTMVMYRALLRSLGYPVNVDLAELEINLEERGQLPAFKSKFAEVYEGRTWDEAKQLLMTALNEASAVLHELDRKTYPAADTWARSRGRAEISPRKLAERALRLSKARAGGRNVVFVVDEIGQYTARDLSRIGDLQGVIESFSVFGKGKIWLIATSQEKLEAIIDIYERDRTELVRLQDRFAYKVFLSPSDIREVASHRVLSKKGVAEPELRSLYQKHKGQLGHATQVSGAVPLPMLEEDSFVSLYPLLPYQVDLVINVVSGLRRQVGGPQTMGGANRTIIKLAQQLLIHPRVGLADASVGRLVTLDSVYDLIATNIASEIQQEIDEIERTLGAFPARVAKALALLQFAEAIHTTEENVAAVLHPAVNAPSVLPEVREAVEKLIQARKVRRGEHGLKIQSPAERTWDEERDSRRPTSGDRMRLIKESMEQVWGKGAHAPKSQLGGWKQFTAGLKLGNELLVEGDVPFEVRILDPVRSTDEQAQDARAATQHAPDLVTWLIEMTEKAEHQITEAFRSERMQGRPVRTKEEEGLLREEGRRLQIAKDNLRAELTKSLCRGRIFFRGAERSPSEEAVDPKTEARRVLDTALQQIFHRFADGDVKVTREDAEAILKSESLAGLPSCYSDLGLIQTVDGQARLATDHGAAKEILDWVRLRCDEGRAPSGREIEQHFTGAPYGWAFDLLQLLLATLLRAGQVTIKAQGQQIKNALIPEARSQIINNTRFRAVTVSIREATLDARKVRDAAKALETRFGYRCPALTVESVATVLRQKLATDPEVLRMERSRETLRTLRLPGDMVLTQGLDAFREIRNGDNEAAVQAFLVSADTLSKAIPRARAIEERLTEAVRLDVERAQLLLERVAPVLEHEPGVSDDVRQALSGLRDCLAKETFYDHLPEIQTTAATVLSAFQALYNTAFLDQKNAYQKSLSDLSMTPGWGKLDAVTQEAIAKPIKERAEIKPDPEPWRRGSTGLSLLREQALAARALLERAQGEVRHALTPQAVEIRVSAFLNGPIDSPEELDAVITALREAVEKALAEGQPVVLI